jgi:CheY-like chemotaxis protein
LRILIIDDLPANRKRYAAQFANKGWEAVVAEGNSTQEIFRYCVNLVERELDDPSVNFHFDYTILDVMLWSDQPSGFSLMQELFDHEGGSAHRYGLIIIATKKSPEERDVAQFRRIAAIRYNANTHCVSTFKPDGTASIADFIEDWEQDFS